MHLASFQNCASTVISFIDAAQHSLLASVCWFTHPGIFNALHKACGRKVKVKIIIDYDQINFKPQGLDFQALERAGATVMGYPGPDLMHHKFAIADGIKVLSGSFNWTKTTQCEHLVVSHDVTLASQFCVAFEALALRSKSLANLRQIVPRQISFTQLYQPRLWGVQDLRKAVIAGAKTWLIAIKSSNEWQNWVHNQQHYLSVKTSLGTWPNLDIIDSEKMKIWLGMPPKNVAIKGRISAYVLRVRQGDIFIAIGTSGEFFGAGIVGSDAAIYAQTPNRICRFVQWIECENEVALSPVQSISTKITLTRYKGSALELIAALAPQK